MNRRVLSLVIPAILAFGSAISAQGSSPPRLVGPVFLALQTSDVDAASAWYQEVFELDEIIRTEAPDGRYTIAILAGGQLHLELIRSSDAREAPPRHRGIFKVGLYVEDIDVAHRWITGKGVSADATWFEDSALQARSFVLRDLDGNRLQMFESCESRCGEPS